MVSIKAEDCHCMTVIGYKLTGICYQLSEESILDSRFTVHSSRLRAPCSTLPALRCSPVVPWSRSLPLTSHFSRPLLHAPCSMLHAQHRPRRLARNDPVVHHDSRSLSCPSDLLPGRRPLWAGG